VVQDHAEAAKWYRLAAAQGHVRAQNQLGLLHDSGKGVVQDHAKAMTWYLLAAEQGSASAQFNLGLMHDQGQGVVRDPKKALMWFSLAADKGSSESVKARDSVAQRMTAQQIGEAQTKARQCLERNFKGCD
jgi:TPR repeat protein